mmetsp:Transcript_49651/g.82666  ORF Transcript_49651/g.82666 Transcript_49651/m.82666 type:complete len:93 (+) Transcript_49651:583-861(+)
MNVIVIAIYFYQPTASTSVYHFYNVFDAYAVHIFPCSIYFGHTTMMIVNWSVILTVTVILSTASVNKTAKRSILVQIVYLVFFSQMQMSALK